jgi:hypothetical protein
VAHPLRGHGRPELDFSDLRPLLAMRARLRVELCQGRGVVGDLACVLDRVPRRHRLDEAQQEGCGIVAQLMFSMRFIIQWLVSDEARLGYETVSDRPPATAAKGECLPLRTR